MGAPGASRVKRVKPLASDGRRVEPQCWTHCSCDRASSLLGFAEAELNSGWMAPALACQTRTLRGLGGRQGMQSLGYHGITITED